MFPFLLAPPVKSIKNFSAYSCIAFGDGEVGSFVLVLVLKSLHHGLTFFLSFFETLSLFFDVPLFLFFNFTYATLWKKYKYNWFGLQRIANLQLRLFQFNSTFWEYLANTDLVNFVDFLPSSAFLRSAIFLSSSARATLRLACFSFNFLRSSSSFARCLRHSVMYSRNCSSRSDLFWSWRLMNSGSPAPSLFWEKYIRNCMKLL